MAILADSGTTVTTLVLFGDGKGADAARRDACCASSKVLGTDVPSFAELPENAGDTVPLGDVIGIVETFFTHIVNQNRAAEYVINWNVEETLNLFCV